jgi:hypothetical protein
MTVIQGAVLHVFFFFLFITMLGSAGPCHNKCITEYLDRFLFMNKSLNKFFLFITMLGSCRYHPKNKEMYVDYVSFLLTYRKA